MYNNYDKSNIYYLYDRDKNITKKIGDINDLIFFVANMMRHWYRENHHMCGTRRYDYYHHIGRHMVIQKWTPRDINVVFRGKLYPIVFNCQNLTGKDIYITSKTIVHSDIDDETGEIKKNYTYIHTKHLYPYTFYNGNGAVFDIRRIMPEVKMCLLNGLTKKPKRKNHISKYLIWKHGRSKFHVIYGKRHKNKYRPERLSRRSSGWKDHKYRKQWMHNMKNDTVSAKMYWKDYDYEELSIYDFAEDYSINERSKING